MHLPVIETLIQFGLIFYSFESPSAAVGLRLCEYPLVVCLVVSIRFAFFSFFPCGSWRLQLLSLRNSCVLSESHKYPRRNGSEHLRLDSRSPALFDTLQIQTPNKTRPIVEKSQSFFFCFSNFSSVFARGCPQNIGRRTTSYMYNCPGFSLLQSLLLCGLSFQPIERRFISFRHLLPFFSKTILHNRRRRRRRIRGTWIISLCTRAYGWQITYSSPPTN